MGAVKIFQFAVNLFQLAAKCFPLHVKSFRMAVKLFQKSLWSEMTGNLHYLGQHGSFKS